MAITTVLPEPVAILQPNRVRAGRPASGGAVDQLRNIFVRESGPERRALAAHANLGEVDDRFDGFQLAEEEPAYPVLAPPVAQELSRDVRDVPVAGIPPSPHVLPETVDVGQLLPVLLGQQSALLWILGTLASEPVPRRASARRTGRFSGTQVVKPVLGGLLMMQCRSPYMYPQRPWGVACSMSSYIPSLLVHLPLSSCRAACVHSPSRTYNATFSYPVSMSWPPHSSYPRMRNRSTRLCASAPRSPIQ